MKDKLYKNHDIQIEMDSLHIIGKADPLAEFISVEPFLYKPGHSGLPPTVIMHDEGHKVPSKYKHEHFLQICDFLRLQYVSKFGSDVEFNEKMTS